jgi:3'(2'), 5'-bisphosphate nucleotidase
MKTNYQNELDTIVDLAREVSREILPLYYGNFQARLKADTSPVTQADVRANEMIVDRLQKQFPGDGIVSEELGDIAGGRTWYVDPIDGTRSFVNHTDHFAIHIGLVDEEKLVLGLVYRPTSGEYYHAVSGKGAFRCSPDGIETKLEVNDKPTLWGGLVLTGNNQFITSDPGKSIYELLKPSRFVNVGGGGLRMAKIAENIADMHISLSGKASSWDICAPQIIVEEAGGIISYSDGRPVTYHRQHAMDGYIIVAKNQKSWDLAAEAVRKVVG